MKNRVLQEARAAVGQALRENAARQNVWGSWCASSLSLRIKQRKIVVYCLNMNRILQCIYIYKYYSYHACLYMIMISIQYIIPDIQSSHPLKFIKSRAPFVAASSLMAHHHAATQHKPLHTAHGLLARPNETGLRRNLYL